MISTRWMPGIVALGVFLHSTAVEAQSSRHVDVGSHVLHAMVSGAGEPVVVLDAGGGDDLEAWDPVRERIAEFTTVVAYSRAGLGESGPSDSPRTPLHVSEELGRLLDGLGIQGPVVLVGHSLGGLYSRVFAAKNPTRVGALVLVDGTHERQYREMSLLSPTFWEDARATFDEMAATGGGAVAAELEELWSILQRGTLPEAYPLPDVPTVALTAQRADSTWVGSTEPGLRTWRELHRDYVQFHEGSRQILVPESGHYIQHDAPTLVVEVIREIVLSLRDSP